jgi:exopolysaccharide biosynthesis polyprenyl glycosylphosphotransferase
MSIRTGALESRRFLLFATEQLVLFGGFLLAASIVCLLSTPFTFRLLIAEAMAATGLLQFGFYLADLYDLNVAFTDAPSGARLLRVLGLITMASGILTFFIPLSPSARIAAIAGLGGTCAAALPLRALLPRLGRRVAVQARLLIVGRGASRSLFEREIERDGTCEVVEVATLSAPRLAARARANHVDAVVVAMDDRRGLNVHELLSCRIQGFEVMNAAEFFEAVLKKIPVELLRPSDLVFTEGFSQPAWLRLARRVISFTGALALLAIASPILILAAFFIQVDSKGGVFYNQDRVGANGRVFRMRKFRTMRIDAEAGGIKWAQVDDPRVTRVGRILRRFRIDELPQLFNVLRGEMGLIGPRPERPAFVRLLSEKLPYYGLRNLVPPGITGWAQVRYPYAASLEEAREKLKYDLYYVKHLSVGLDLRILFHTAKVVLFGRGAR